MKKLFPDLTICVAMITSIITLGILSYKEDREISSQKSSLTIETTPFKDPLAFKKKPPEEGLMEALKYYDILFPDIVYAQAILETGYFKSSICVKNNNLFGLYNSKKKEYYKFNHWSESVVAYKSKIQNRYYLPEDYYIFLKRINYAEDSLYIDKLKQIVKNNDKRTSTGRN